MTNYEDHPILKPGKLYIVDKGVLVQARYYQHVDRWLLQGIPVRWPVGQSQDAAGQENIEVNYGYTFVIKPGLRHLFLCHGRETIPSAWTIDDLYPAAEDSGPGDWDAWVKAFFDVWERDRQLSPTTMGRSRDTPSLR